MKVDPDEAVRMYDSGLSTIAIADRFDCWPNQVREVLLRRGVVMRPRHWRRLPDPIVPRLPAHESICCLALRDALGRLPVGWCGPDCLRRPVSGSR